MTDDTDAIADTFDLLGDETRVAILSALVEARREDPESPAVPFSELRERVGVRDSGQFNYHLKKLRGRFVTKGDDGYKLTYAGRSMAGAILAGRYTEDTELGPTELDTPCPICGAALIAAYEDGVVDVTCADDHTIFRNGFPPGAAADRTMPELLDVVSQTTYNDLELTYRDTCSNCYGSLDRRIERDDQNGDPASFYVFDCDRCGQHLTNSIAVRLLVDPTTQSFLADHGDPLRERWPWTLEFVGDPEVETLVSEDPLRHRVTVERGDERLVVDLEEGDIVSTRRESI